eukprot:5193266-Pleurochrysis_carterae.AAC.2
MTVHADNRARDSHLEAINRAAATLNLTGRYASMPAFESPACSRAPRSGKYVRDANQSPRGSASLKGGERNKQQREAIVEGCKKIAVGRRSREKLIEAAIVRQKQMVRSRGGSKEAESSQGSRMRVTYVVSARSGPPSFAHAHTVKTRRVIPCRAIART